MKKHKLTAIAAISLTVGVIAPLLANTKSASADYMDDYFRNGMTIKLVTPKGFNVNLPYPTNGGMINTFEPDNTGDWKFVVIRSSADGFKLKRVGTNHLITTKDFPARNLTLLEAWQDVGGEDKFQTWVAIPTRPGYFAICLKAQRDQCMNVPNSTNRTKLTTYKFDANDQDQMFSAVPINSSPNNIDIQGLQRLLFRNVTSTVTSPYGYQNCKFWKDLYVDCKHPALDIASPVLNTPIYSPIDGKVIARNDNWGAVWVYNEKSKITFLFVHMSSTNASVGNQVSTGTQVGTQGHKDPLGNSTGDHLHFETRPGYHPGEFANSMSQTINPLD